MGSVGFYGEDEYRSSTDNVKKNKPPRTLLDGCGAVNHVSVPRKLRSAIKKQRCESVTPPLPNSSKQHHTSDGVGMLRKDGSKRSKLNMTEGHVSKDEEEVAETLNALADMFSDANKANQSRLNNEPPEMKSSAALEAEDTGNLILQGKSRKLTSNFNLEAASHSSTSVDPRCQVSDNAQQPQLHSSKQPATPSASGKQSESLGRRSRVSTIDTVPIVKEAVAPDEVMVPRTLHGSHYPMDDRNNGLSLSPSLSAGEALNSMTQGSHLWLPAWFENRNSAPQPCVIEECTATAAKNTRAHKSWKRSSAHVYISRLIEVLQISERKEGSLEKPAQPTTSGGAELQMHARIHNQMAAITGSNGYSTNIPNDIVSHKRSLQQQQQASETSAVHTSTNRCYDFLSLGSGVYNSTSSEIINRKVHCHAPYMQSQNHAARPFSLTQNGYSALAAQQVQHPQYLSSIVNSSISIGMAESLQQKCGASLPTQYNTIVASLHLPDWRNGAGDSPSLHSNAPAIFPRLHTALASRYQQFSPPQPLLTSINSSSSLPLSNMKIRHEHQFPMHFERNGAVLYHENIRQLQLPCNEHLRN